MLELQRNLFEYQKNGVEQMTLIETSECSYENRGRGSHVVMKSRCGILADPTGSGKTTTMLAFIGRRYKILQHQTDQTTITRQYGAFVKERITLDPLGVDVFVDTTVVVVSPNLTAQWSKEANKVLGMAPKVLNTVAHVKSFVQCLVANTDTPIVIVNENRYRYFCLLVSLQKIGFARFVFDECRHLRCINTPVVMLPTTIFTWFISASATDSPHANDFFVPCTSPCSMMMHLCMMPQELVSSISVRTPLNEINYPGTVIYKTYNCRSLSAVTDIIVDSLDSDMRTRILAGDIQGALALLGAEEASDIFSVVMHKLRRDLRQVRFSLQEICDDIAAGVCSENAVRNRIQSLTDQEQNLVRQTETSEARFQNLLSTGTCSICLDNFTEPTLISCCSNVFCGECIISSQVRAQKCPLCRSPAYKLHRVAVDGRVAEPTEDNIEERPQSKFQVLKQIMANEASGKILVYAEWEMGWNLLRDLAKELGITALRLQGHVKTRCDTIQNFKTCAGRVALWANGISDCSGIDLPEVTDIVLWHKMSPAKTQQIIGRCRRVSTEASSNCTVHKLYEGEE